MTEEVPAIDALLAKLERESRLKQRQATWLLIGLIAFGLVLLGTISYQIQRAYLELAGISQSVDRLRAEKATLEKDKQLLSGAVRSLDSEAHPLPGLTSPAAEQNALPTRVYIHIAREDQREKARELSRALFAKGFIAPGIELVSKAPAHTVLKFFRQTERNIAEDIAARMQAVRIPVTIDFLPGFEDRVRPKHFEVWFGNRE